MSVTQSHQRDPVDELAEEFADRLRRGDHPTIEEYTRQYPQWSERIQQVFAALIVMERLKPKVGDDTHSLGEDTSADERQEQPTRIGDYRILREVGRGGMGVVYEAEQMSLGRHVALKVLQASAVMDSKHVARFAREARAAARMHHTNIVPVFGVGREGNLHYYVMQFIQGQPLDDVLAEMKWLRKERAAARPLPVEEHPSDNERSADDRSRVAQIAAGLLSGEFSREPNEPQPAESAADSAPTMAEPPARLNDSSAVLPGATDVSTVTHSETAYWQCVARLGHQVAEALEYAHGQGVLHRDIKPANLLLDHRGTVWVTDFGLATVGQDDRLTKTGDIVGTLRYMAPEAFHGKYEFRSDIYGLGLTLYEMIALRPAFDAIDRSRLMRQVTSGEVPRLRKFNPNVPRDLEKIVMKSLEHEPAHRYTTGRQLADDLQRFLDDKPIRARQAGSLERTWRWSRRNPALAVSLAAVAALLVFLAVAGQLVATRQTALANQESAAREAGRQTLYVSDMNQAVEAWEHADMPRLLELLERHRPEVGQQDLRGFEWFHFWRNYQTTLKQPGFKHNASVRAASFSRDGKIVVTASGNTLWLWDVAKQVQCGTLKGHETIVTAVDVSPDGLTIASGSQDGTVIVWDLATGKQRFMLNEHSEIVRDVAFSHDGSSLVSISWDAIRWWNVATGNKLQTLSGKKGPGLSVAFSSDGTIAMGGRRRVNWWNVAQPAEMHKMPGYRSHVDCVAFSPDSKLLAICINAAAVLWDREAEQQFAVLRGHLAPILDLEFSPDGTALATGGVDGTVRIWDIQTGLETAIFKGHQSQVNCVAFSPDSTTVVSGGDDATLKLWHVNRRDSINLKGHTAIVPKLVFSPDNKKLATVSYDQPSLAMWDLTSGHVDVLTEESTWLSCLSFSMDGKKLFVGGGSNIRAWDVASREEIKELVKETHSGDITGMLCSPDGKTLVTGTRDGDRSTLKVWDTQTWEPIAALGDYRSHRGGLAFSPKGQILAAPASDYSVTLYDADTWQVIDTLKGHTDEIQDLSFSPDGKKLASASNDGTVKLWNMANHRVTATLTGHRSYVDGVVFSPTDKTLVSVGRDATVRVWNFNFEPPQLVASLRGHTSSVLCAQFSPDGKTLATSSITGRIKLWRAAAR